VTVYLDASVVLSIITADVHSDRAARWYAALQASVIISDLANLEVCAVISRELRAKRFSRPAADQALLDFDALRAASERATFGAQDFAIADRLVRDFATKLAAADALHLASALSAGATLATFDARLAGAARAEGVAVADID